MGTLDDAIREHLELKRRSGVSDEEVSKLESDAFGPARRAAPPEPAFEAPEADPIAAEEPALAEPPVAPPPEPEDPPVAEHELPSPPAKAEPSPAKAEDWMEDEPTFEPKHEPSQTAEFTAAEAAEATGVPPTDYVAPDEEGDDLLEETPDFLQETPEHDRLWFEQKPPKDFDFDG